MNVETAQIPVSILARLRAETRPEHDAIEAALDLTSETLTLDAYRHTLERSYGFYHPLEAQLAQVGGWIERGLDLTKRQKAPLLAADLRALGAADLTTFPLCTDLPPHGTAAAALGCVYVMEGATLGGQVISKAVAKSLGLTPETGGRFFHSYGDRTGLMWQGFRTAISTCVVTVADQDEAVDAAKKTFQSLHRWMSAGGNPR